MASFGTGQARRPGAYDHYDRRRSVTHQIYGHLDPTSWDRARSVLDVARRAGRHRPPSENPMLCLINGIAVAAER